MRKADFDSARNRCRTQPLGGFSITRIESQDVPVRGVSLASRILCLVGANGAGKTSLLKGIGSRFLVAEAPPRAEALRISGAFQGAEFAIEDVTATVPEGLTAKFLDVSEKCHEILGAFRSREALDDLVDQTGLVELSENHVDRYRYVCNRNYSAIEVAEVELPSPVRSVSDVRDPVDAELFPYFKVCINGLTYDTLSMGFGELCAFYLVWSLFQSPKGTLLLLDEPDSHLSPQSRRCLIDMMIFAANERKLVVLFSSHLLESVEELSESEMALVHSAEDGSQVSMSAVTAKRRVVRELGLASPRCLLVCVEDIDALETVRQIINRWGANYANVADIQLVEGGAPNVSSFVSRFPAAARSCRAVAVLDGDQRSTYTSDRMLFLPGTGDPISAAREVARADPSGLASKLNVEVELVIDASNAVLHVDDHDFCARLLQALAIEADVARIRTALIAVWLADPGVAAEARSLADRIREYVDSAPLFPR